MKPLNKLAYKIYKNAVKKGFYDNLISIGTNLMLIVSELSEALEADRQGLRANLNEFEEKLNSLQKPNNEDFRVNFELYVKDTFEDEITDTLLRLLDMCAYYNIDIDKHVELKMRYNKLRPYKHGKKY